MSFLLGVTNQFPSTAKSISLSLSPGDREKVPVSSWEGDARNIELASNIGVITVQGTEVVPQLYIKDNFSSNIQRR